MAARRSRSFHALLCASRSVVLTTLLPLAAGCSASPADASATSSESLKLPPGDGCDPSECPKPPPGYHGGGSGGSGGGGVAPQPAISLLKITPTNDGASLTFDTPGSDVVTYYVRPHGTATWTRAGSDAQAGQAHSFTFTGLDACTGYDFAEVFYGDSQYGDFDARSSPGFFQSGMAYSVWVDARGSSALVYLTAADGIARPHTGNLNVYVVDNGPRATSPQWVDGNGTDGTSSLLMVNGLFPQENYNLYVSGCGADSATSFVTKIDSFAIDTGDLETQYHHGHGFLLVSSDGSYTYTGSVHDAGFLSGNYALGIGFPVGDPAGTLFGVDYKGSVSGSDAPWGNTDDSWSISGKSALIAANWDTIRRDRVKSVLSVSTDLWNIAYSVIAPIYYVVEGAGDVIKAINWDDQGSASSAKVCGQVVDGKVVSCGN